MKCFKLLLIALVAAGAFAIDSRDADTVARESANFRQNINEWRYEITREWNEMLVDDLDSLHTFLAGVGADSAYWVAGEHQRLIADSISGLEEIVFTDNPSNPNKSVCYGILRTSIVTIGHPGETGTDWAFTSAANSNEESIGADTIPAYARILDVTIITTEAVAGVTTDFTVDIGDGAGTDEFAAATDIKAANALIGGDASEAILLMPITTETVIFVNANPNAENWDAMTGGEFSLITTYLDYGSVK